MIVGKEYIAICGDAGDGAELFEVAELVRCKDCMENTINTDGATEPWCYKFGYVVEDTDFCSYGERIEE